MIEIQYLNMNEYRWENNARLERTYLAGKRARNDLV